MPEHLGMADFRGYAALEVTGRPGHMRWEVIEPWNLARPVRNGGWLYNPEAQDEIYNLEELDMSRVILRETRRPIDLAAMFLVVEKSHGTHAWDAFLDTFGVPSIFFELAPNTSEEDAQEFDAVINRVLAEGRARLESREGEAEEGEPLTAEELALMKQYGEAGSLDLGKLAGEYEKRLEEAAPAGFEAARRMSCWRAKKACTRRHATQRIRLTAARTA